MPVFDLKKTSENAMLWLAIIGFFTIIILVAKVVFKSPLLLVTVSLLTPLAGLVWSKYKIALFDKYEQKNVATGMLIISVFCSIFIGTNNGKVESYIASLLVEGKIVKYELYVEAEDIYEGRSTIPPHYEDAFRFEPADNNNWVLDFIKYMIIFITIAIPVINYMILRFAIKKTEIMKKNDEYNKKRKSLVALRLQ